MTRKGLIVVEQMPLLLTTPTSQELLFKATLVLSGPLTTPVPSCCEKQRILAFLCLRAVKLKVSKLTVKLIKSLKH